MITIPTVDQLEFDTKRVLYRVDYNVPVDDAGVITDATRIEETLPTIRLMRERGARIIIASHFGRPKGTKSVGHSLHCVREKLEQLSGVPVDWVTDCIGEEAQAHADALKPGQILLLENLRFHPEEEANDEAFAADLRRLAEVYVNDAFGACHRAHASIVALPRLFPADARAGGLLLSKELDFLQKVTEVSDAERPFVAILGGAKIAGKIEPLEMMVKLADFVLIGGGMANTFFASQGRSMGASLVDSDSVSIASRILSGSPHGEVVLPVDVVVTDSLDDPKQVRTVRIEDGLAEKEMAVDIGEQTMKRFTEIIAQGKTIFWNGPMGVFENEEFAIGTRVIARAIAEHPSAISIIGGGESVEAVKQSGFADKISHISTGGGAALEFISGAALPGIEILRKES